MKSLKISVVGFACTLALVVMRGAVSAPASTNGPTRNFVFTYLTKIPALSPDDKVSRMWIPLPQSDRYQTIRNLKIDAPFAYAERRDPEYGNEYLYVQVPPSKLKEPSEVRVSFEATRREHRVSLDARSAASESRPISPDLQRFLQPDRLIPLQGTIEDFLRSRLTGMRTRSPRPAPFTTTSSPPCVTTSPARAGVTGMPSGLAPPSAATAPIFTLC